MIDCQVRRSGCVQTGALACENQWVDRFKQQLDILLLISGHCGVEREKVMTRMTVQCCTSQLTHGSEGSRQRGHDNYSSRGQSGFEYFVLLFFPNISKRVQNLRLRHVSSPSEMSLRSTRTLDHIIHLTPPCTIHDAAEQFRQLGFKSSLRQ